jgi:NTE family protein
LRAWDAVVELVKKFQFGEQYVLTAVYCQGPRVKCAEGGLAMAKTDLVLEGGGVKGTGLVGALSAMVDRPDPYSFQRVAGTSAGAIVASMVASGISVEELKQIMVNLDFSKFEDLPPVFKHFRQIGEAYGLIFKKGMFSGDFLHKWIQETLAAKGVHTWRDLKQDDPDSALPPQQRYKLVVIVSDVSQGRMLRIPWDYQPLLGIDPDDQPVADAVRASASIPFFFRPFAMKADPNLTRGHGAVLCTDGGMLSNYPINIFDRHDGNQPRWPTLGVKLSAQRPLADGKWDPDANALQLGLSLISTMEDAHDQMHIDKPFFSSRTIFVDTTGYKATDFHLTEADKLKLFANGQDAATEFLKAWDWEAWKAKYANQ